MALGGGYFKISYEGDLALVDTPLRRAALTVFGEFGPGTIYARNRELTASLRAALAGIGWDPAELPAQNQSTIVSVPLGNAGPARLLRGLSGQGIICSARFCNLCEASTVRAMGYPVAAD
jgi:selenocysteine lyase/cysteine desulfurase